MRLINTVRFGTGRFETVEFDDGSIPPYAILSHTWDEEEVTLQDVGTSWAEGKRGYEKIKECCSLARTHGFEYVWIDTCCIDKTSSAELSEAINSMYRWYQEAEMCYAYLADVPSQKSFPESRWFTRGWTLQELIAPCKLIFLDENWKELGTKSNLRETITRHTGIPTSILVGDDDLEVASIAQRMSWASKRETKRTEDRAYSLMGIFGVNMPLIYGEGETAFIRLQEEIMRISDDQSLFAWMSLDNRGGLLATSPTAFMGCGDIVQCSPPSDTSSTPSTSTSRGIQLGLPLIGHGRGGLGLAVLYCHKITKKDSLIALYVKDLTMAMVQFERVQTERFIQIDLRRFRPSQYPVRRIFLKGGRMSRIGRPKGLPNGGSLALDGLYLPSILAALYKFGGLLRAAEEGLEDDVWLLLTRSDVEVNMTDQWGHTPLALATNGGHVGVVKLLLERGASPDARDHSTLTPLQYAIETGHEAIARLLLDRGAATEVLDHDRETPLLCAVQRGQWNIVQLLLEKGANFEARGKTNCTPLLCAVEGGHEDILNLLLVHGASTDDWDGLRRTPLIYAAILGRTRIVARLLEHGTELVEVKDRFGRTALSYAAEKGYEDIVKILRSIR